MLRVVQVTPIGEYRLAVSFSDGSSGEADLSKHVQRAPFLPIAEPSVFRTATIEHGAVVWPDVDVDIATEALYALAHGLPAPRSQADVEANVRAVRAGRR